LDEGQVLNRYFKYFGLMDKLKLKRMDADSFDVVVFESDGKDYPYAMGHENFINTLSEHFPQDRQAIKKYIEKMLYVCEHFPLYNLSYSNMNISETELFYENAASFISQITSNQRLRNVLAGTIPLYAGSAEKTPLYVHSLVTNSFIESSWRVMDGSSQMAVILADAILKNGGCVRANAEVTEFVFRNDTLCSVKLKSGEEVIARQYISDIHPVRTLEMIDEKYLRKAYRDRIVDLKNTTSNFSIYITFHKDSFPYINHNLYYYTSNDVWSAPDYTEANWPGNFLLITPAVSRSEKFADGAIIMAYMHFDDVRKWENTDIGKRGNEYLEFKETKAEKLLDLVEHRFPGFRKHIKSYNTSSPLTYRDYTATFEGSLYGIMKDCNEPLKTLISPKTKIPNLFFTGQNTILHGVLGVTISAITTCALFLGTEYLVDKIKKC
jgi:all-trans-retinol 13,14-reductase